MGNGHGAASELEQALSDFGLDWNTRWLDDAGPLLDGEPGTVDVVVCGMQVGDRRGPDLLAALRDRHPEAVRILLLDDGQDADALRSMASAHRLLRRPLDAGELIEAVESVVELRELLDNPALKEAIGRVESLPPPPKLYLDLTQLLRDPETSSAEVAELLSQDPVLAAKMLRLCNSAYFSAGRVVTDIRAAVTRLGLQNTQQLVLATEAFGTPAEVDGIDREAMQARALRTSRLAAQILGGSSAELAATAGLLAEVGSLLPGMRSTLPDGTEQNPDAPHFAEAGAYLLGLWGLPMPIVEAVANHHQPGRMRMSGFWVAGAVHVAAALVAGTEVDEAYLRSVGQIDKLPKWRLLGENLAEAA
ncbi:HDOD domain-containing protein [Novilysobacter arseniciresistens]|uniref:HDOD domain-containing protein n=1 Tax=Novilysobacter arseniciresistens TaxID=1385522 RepID=UPI00126A722E|nr:HDOD domain-containing protein [Lysobacter arseniciresistens]